ncbi:MAG: hypothetical protein V4580_18925 [Bacteroidota bacterium]
MKPKHTISDDITSTPLKKKKGNQEQEGMDSTTPDPTLPDTEITYTKKHTIGDPIEKKPHQRKSS